ncbi:MAG: hypothetical protein J6K85_04250 [Clostridia bacterium]|nr:hypothetical protein [Clostridia bacterium]
MKIALTSIQPPHTDNIFSGKKRIEWRKTLLPLGIHHIYETKRNNGAGMVVGSMEIVRHYSFNSVSEIPDYMIEAGCVPRSFLKSYAGKKKLYANIIINAKKFDGPKLICEYNNYHKVENCNKCGMWQTPPYPCNNCPKNSIVIKPPQSFMYVEENEYKLYIDLW